MPKVPKIATPDVANRRQSPFIAWLRRFMLGYDRQPKTPPAGIPGPDGEAVYAPPNRFPNTQSARQIELDDTKEMPQIADVYYYGRDARRAVKPPTPVFRIGADGAPPEWRKALGEPIPEEQVPQQFANKGPAANFGLRVPTPGFGHEWKRARAREMETLQCDVELAKLEKFDKYMSA